MAVSTKHTGALGVSSALTLSSGTANVDTSGAVAIGSGPSASGSGGNIRISVSLGSGIGGAISADDVTEVSNNGEPASMVAGSLFTTGGRSLAQHELATQLEEMQQSMLVLGPRPVGLDSIPLVKAWPVYTFHGRSNSKITLPFFQ